MRFLLFLVQKIFENTHLKENLIGLNVKLLGSSGFNSMILFFFFLNEIYLIILNCVMLRVDLWWMANQSVNSVKSRETYRLIWFDYFVVVSQSTVFFMYVGTSHPNVILPSFVVVFVVGILLLVLMMMMMMIIFFLFLLVEFSIENKQIYSAQIYVTKSKQYNIHTLNIECRLSIFITNSYK